MVYAASSNGFISGFSAEGGCHGFAIEVGFAEGLDLLATKGFHLPRARVNAYSGRALNGAIRDPNTTVEREIRLLAIIRLIRRTDA
jgi:hypothetical protein